MDDKRIMVEYYQRNQKIRIEATMRYNAVRYTWYCNQIHTVVWDEIIFNLDSDPNELYYEFVKHIVIHGCPYDAVEEMFQEEDYTEIVGCEKVRNMMCDEYSDRGISPKDFV